MPSANVELRTLYFKLKKKLIKRDPTSPNEILNTAFLLISVGPQISAAALGIHIEISAAL